VGWDLRAHVGQAILFAAGPPGRAPAGPPSVEAALPERGGQAGRTQKWLTPTGSFSGRSPRNGHTRQT
jgi:hypothetical protein